MSRRFLPQYLGFGWEVFSAGGGGIWGSRCGAAFSAIGGGFSGDFEVQPGTPVPSALDSPSLLMTAGRPPGDIRGPDKDDRRSGEVERIDPGRIPLALSRSGSGQMGHGPWELVLT